MYYIAIIVSFALLMRSISLLTEGNNTSMKQQIVQNRCFFDILYNI